MGRKQMHTFNNPNLNNIDSKYCCDYCNAMIKSHDDYAYTVSFFYGFKKYHNRCYESLDRWTKMQSLKINSRAYIYTGFISIIFIFLFTFIGYQTPIFLMFLLYVAVASLYQILFTIEVLLLYTLFDLYDRQNEIQAIGEFLQMVRIPAIMISMMALVILIFKYQKFEQGIFSNIDF